MGLHRKYGDTVALDGLTMSIPAGVVFGLLGPNGSGKTTSMRAIMGVTALDAGQINWNGRPIARQDRKHFGYMPEERALYVDMRAAEHLEYFARLHGADKAEARQRTADWLERLGLSDRAKDKIEGLSQGNKQRMQVANTLVHEPKVMMLDEPFSGLDPVGIDFLASVLRDQAERGATVVFSSHQLDVVEHLCSEVAIVHKGRLVSAGSTRDLTAPTGRHLCVEVVGAPSGWEEKLEGVKVLSKENGRLDLELLPGHAPTTVLDAARRAGEVTEFSQVRRKLSDVFLEAVGARVEEVEEREEAAAEADR